MNEPLNKFLDNTAHMAASPSSTKDLVVDTIEAVVSALARQGLSVDRSVRLAAESQIRAAWGGVRVYVAKSQTQEAHARASRDVEIALAAMTGVSVACLSTRYGLSERRIRQILDHHTPSEINCLNDFRSIR